MFEFKSYSKNNLLRTTTNNTIDIVECKGWLKYIIINDFDNSLPTKFIINNSYNKQIANKSNTNLLQKDEIGYINIPNDSMFYVELDASKIIIYSSRDLQYKYKTYEILINDIIPLTSSYDSKYKGGVEDIGNFTEGYCFVIKFVHNGNKKIIEFCSESINEKDNWMNIIASIIKKELNNNIDNNDTNSQLINSSTNASIINNVKSYSNDYSINRIDSNNNSNNNLSKIKSDKTIIITSSNNNTNNNNNTRSFMHRFNSKPSNISITNNLNLETSNNLYTSSQRSGWEAQGDWSNCSKECDYGIKTRNLICKSNNPEDHCLGSNIEEKKCFIKSCLNKVDQSLQELKSFKDSSYNKSNSNWTYTSDWSPCNVSCGNGYKTRQRKCINEFCEGSNFEKEPCYNNDCDTLNNQSNYSNSINNNLDNKLSNISNNNSNNFKLNHKDTIKISVKNLNNNINNNNNKFDSQCCDPCSYKGYLKNNDNTFNNNNQGIFNLNHNEIDFTISNNQVYSIPVKDINEFKLSNSNSSCIDLLSNSNELLSSVCPSESEYSLNNVIEQLNSFQSCANNNNNNKSFESYSQSLNNQKVIENKSKIQALENKYKEFKRQTNIILSQEEQYESALIEAEKEKLDCNSKKYREEQEKELKLAERLLNEIQQISINEQEFKLKENTINRNMENDLKQIQLQIANKRQRLNNRIKTLRLSHEISNRNIAIEALEKKKALGSKMLKMNERKDPNICFNNINNNSFINNYCNDKILDEFYKEECYKPKQFCYICCDNELGVMHQDEIECCYNRCDSVEGSLNKCNEFTTMYNINVIHTLN